MQENIFKPLGLEFTSFRLETHPEIKSRLVNTTERQTDETLKPSKRLWTDHAPEDCAGAGLYSTVDDFIKIIGDLVRDSPILLKEKTVQQMFRGQLPRGSNALKGLNETPDILFAMTGMSDHTKGINFALGGLYIEEETTMKKGTLCWGGLPNLY
ncbi:hypothetical protein V493_07203 [Pseudogymnoascus sp. VKM F-4281 (FW-2241)]|nr:hypothetical protein V493_07203 [Pseudogymnoascus sp. VKM F-4281 (FW-2241)]